MDQIKINFRCYIKEKNTFRISLERQFIDKITKNAYIKGPTKRQCASIKQAFIQNYDDIDDNYNSVPSPEFEVETWTLQKEIKKKQDNSFLAPPTALISSTKNLHQTPACKKRVKYKE